MARYNECQRIGIVYKKFNEIERILNYADIEYFFKRLTEENRSYDPSLFTHTRSSSGWYPSVNQLEIIERVFANELTFFYLLSLNTSLIDQNKLPKLHKRYPKRNASLLSKLPDTVQELFELGPPQYRLMTVLAKDKDIKEFFSAYIGDIMNYRNATSNKMSAFHQNVLKPNVLKPYERAKKKFYSKSQHQEKYTIQYDTEYDIAKIFSSINT